MAPRLQVLILGIGDFFTRRHYNTSFVILPAGQEPILVDCPCPLRKILFEAGQSSGVRFDSPDIKHLILTNLHGDHCNGVEELAFSSKRIRQAVRYLIWPIEVLLGFFVLIGWHPRLAISGAVFLIGLFLATLLRHRARGNLSIRCGCFGSFHNESVNFVVVRNLLLMTLCPFAFSSGSIARSYWSRSIKERACEYHWSGEPPCV